jgi:putative membrane protein
MMNSAGGGWWMMGLGWTFMVLIWMLVIVGLVALVRWLMRQWDERSEARRKTPLELLQERYARGEIGQDEYEQKRRALLH